MLHCLILEIHFWRCVEYNNDASCIVNLILTLFEFAGAK